MIVLAGFMGAGKTTVGRLLAPHLGVPFVDTDGLVEARAARTIAEIFEILGERAFREIEREVVLEALEAEEGVLALGGGAVADPAICTALEWATVVYLKCGYSEAMRRLGVDPGRPLLTMADPKALFDARRDVYERVARIEVDTSGQTPEQVVTEIVERLDLADAYDSPRVQVATPGGSYEVVVASGASAGPYPIDGVANAFLISAEGLATISARVGAVLKDQGLDVRTLVVPDGEHAKQLDVVAELFAALAKLEAHRGDLIVGVGGGTVTDVAGFVASTYNRGMPAILVPTTLLGQVDAAIGGKTAINLPEGKNLIGTFWQPAHVVCDVDLLSSLPDEEFRSGLAEVIKYGFISDPQLLDLVERGLDRLLQRDSEILTEVVTRCVAIKADIVGRDEREGGVRSHLNYGHTFAHAIESTLGYGRIRHGEAVALGMMAAAHLARELGLIGDDVVTRHEQVISAAGLPTRAALDPAALERAWVHDKKYRDGVRFVLLDGIGRPRASAQVEAQAVARAIGKVQA